MLGRSKVLHFETVDSTNSLIKKLIQENPGQAETGLVVVANHQTAGRGRLTGRTWVSPPGKGLLCSIAVSSESYPCLGTQPLPLVVGVLLAQVVESLGANQAPPLQVSLKWPNDLYLQGRKLSGMLIETEGIFSIIGIGMNLNTQEFPPELCDKATSLKILTGQDWDRSQVLQKILQRMDQAFASWRDAPDVFWQSVLNEYRRRDFLKGRTLLLWKGNLPKGGRIDQTPHTVTARGIADDGALVVEYSDGRLENIYSGEVELLIKPQRKNCCG